MNVLSFIHETQHDDIPDHVISFGKRCLLDLIGVMAAGSKTELARIISEHAVSQFGIGGPKAHIMFDGRAVSPAGAALANGMMIDSIDAHDGYKESKGHIGCHALPTILALHEAEGINDGSRFLTDLIIAYEFGARAAMALHGTVSDYHTSGAWGAVTGAALGSRILGLDTEKTRHAMGIGEYHGPRSQMMRVIDHPTMLKDGSGWGAMAGISAAYLAASGFTGAPAITIEGEEVTDYWSDLGKRWTMPEQYFKPYPVCRWAQPATAAALSVSKENGVGHEDIDRIEVFSFHEACRLATRSPADTEQAQYSLPFPVAAALVFGKIGPHEISGDRLNDERVLTLSDKIILTEADEYNAIFPKDRFAHVEVTLKDGRVLKSERHRAQGDPETPLSDVDIAEKFHGLADPVLGEKRSESIRLMVEELDEKADFSAFLKLLKKPT